MEKDRRYDRSAKGRFRSGKTRAKQKGIAWSISFPEYEKIIENKCTYCGGELSPTGWSLDRMDNDKGYRLDNVVPCCGECNSIKSDKLSYREARIALAAVSAYRKSK